jgi:SAM-dependent methyltransferase
MGARDVFRYINDLDAATLDRIVDRLEYRGRDPVFAGLREAYLDRLALPPDARVLDLGTGTGLLPRALASRPGFTGLAIGVDQSPALLDAARRLAAEAGLVDRVAFAIGDAHALGEPAASFDAVIAHTTISHVAEPLTVLREMARVVRPGGSIAIFDGDYASLTFAHPDPALGKAMDEALISAIVNNPRVMRDLPRLLAEAGLERLDTSAHVYVDIGPGRFFGNFVDAYTPLLVRNGSMPAAVVEDWVAEQRRAMQAGTSWRPAITTPTSPAVPDTSGWRPGHRRAPDGNQCRQGAARAASKATTSRFGALSRQASTSRPRSSSSSTIAMRTRR